MQNGVGSYFQAIDSVDQSVRDYIEQSLHVFSASGLLKIAATVGKCQQLQSQSVSDQLDELERQRSNLKAQYDLAPDPALSAKLDDLTEQFRRVDAEVGRHGDTTTFSRRELDTVSRLFNQWGAVAFTIRDEGTKVEARLNLLVAHQFAHHVRELLAPHVKQRVDQLFASQLAVCDHANEAGAPELLTRDPQSKSADFNARHFISALARTSVEEYWAESAAAFSIQTSRDSLRLIDSQMFELLRELVLAPDTMVADQYQEHVRAVHQGNGITAESVQKCLD